MNFFKLYIGDYQRDTAALSIAEHGAYVLMLQHYYATEQPLPQGKTLHRLLRATQKAERDAIDSVVAHFWVSKDGGLVNLRAEAEISKASKQCSTNRATAQTREDARRRARTEHESCDESSNGSNTNRPTNRARTEHESLHETGHTRTQNQTPDTRLSDPSGLRETIEASPLVASASPPRPPPCPTSEIVDLYHRHLPMLPRVAVVESRKAAISARWRDVLSDPEIARSTDPKAAALDWFGWYFGHAATSRFLTGKAKDWRADLDFLLQPKKFARVIEGAYHREVA